MEDVCRRYGVNSHERSRCGGAAVILAGLKYRWIRLREGGTHLIFEILQHLIQMLSLPRKQGNGEHLVER